MATHNVTIALDSLFCYHGGDSDGASEPYLWTIMYKIDGEGIRQDGVTLAGEPVYFLSPGSQGNLGHDVGTGGTVHIPAAVGRWTTSLAPILISNPATGTVIEVPGQIGVIAILMEENLTPNVDMEVGHQALNAFVRKQLKAFVDSINLLGVAAEMQPLIAGGASEPDALRAVLAARRKPYQDNLTELTKAVTFYALFQALGFGGAIASGIDRDEFQGTYSASFSEADFNATSANPGQSGLKPIRILELLSKPGEVPGASYAYNLHGAAWREVKVTWIDVTDDVPPGRWRITGIQNGYSRYVGRYISRVGGTFADGSPWILSRGKACSMIEAGTHSFYVMGDDGSQADVIATDELHVGHLYLKTVPNDSKADNLGSLPPCPVALRHEEDV